MKLNTPFTSWLGTIAKLPSRLTLTVAKSYMPAPVPWFSRLTLAALKPLSSTSESFAKIANVVAVSSSVVTASLATTGRSFTAPIFTVTVPGSDTPPSLSVMV